MTGLQSIDLGDGRRLDTFLQGEGDHLLIYHHGTPAAGPMDAAIIEAAAEQGMRVAELVRPGYGSSTRQPGRSVADVAPLVTALADHLGASRFVTMGWSGGGPHALATAALLPDRCAAAMCLAGVAPFGVGVDFLDGMGQDNIEEFGAALEGEQALRPYLQEQCAALSTITGPDVVAAIESLLPPVDQAFLTGEKGEEMATAFRWATQTVDGWLDDDVAFTRPWGFDLAAIRVPASIWQGEEDLMVPFAHGQWLARNVPTADAHLLSGHGHLSLAAESLRPGFAQLRAALDAAGGTK